jgi:hypothetical protein
MVPAGCVRACMRAEFEDCTPLCVCVQQRRASCVRVRVCVSKADGGEQRRVEATGAAMRALSCGGQC